MTKPGLESSPPSHSARSHVSPARSPKLHPSRRSLFWDTRELAHFLRGRATAPFAWGTNDCCMFPADAIKSFAGIDLAADFRGKYHDEASAMALIKSVTGGSTVADAAAWCAKQHGLVEWTHPLMAKRGDLAVISNGGNLIAGIVHLDGRHVVTVAESGLVVLRILNVQRAWAV